MSVIHVKTTSGFECDVNEAALNDYEVLDYIAEIQINSNPLFYPLLVKKLLGADGEKALREHVRKDDGFVDNNDIAVEVTDIFTSIKAGKN